MKPHHQFMVCCLLLIFFLVAAMYYDYFWKETVDIYQDKVKEFRQPEKHDLDQKKADRQGDGPIMPGSIGLSVSGWGTEISPTPRQNTDENEGLLEDFFPDLDHRREIEETGPRQPSLQEQIKMLEVELARKRKESDRREQEIKEGEARLRALRKLEQERKAGER